MWTSLNYSRLNCNSNVESSDHYPHPLYFLNQSVSIQVGDHFFKYLHTEDDKFTLHMDREIDCIPSSRRKVLQKNHHINRNEAYFIMLRYAEELPTRVPDTCGTPRNVPTIKKLIDFPPSNLFEFS